MPGQLRVVHPPGYELCPQKLNVLSWPLRRKTGTAALACTVCTSTERFTDTFLGVGTKALPSLLPKAVTCPFCTMLKKGSRRRMGNRRPGGKRRKYSHAHTFFKQLQQRGRCDPTHTQNWRKALPAKRNPATCLSCTSPSTRDSHGQQPRPFIAQVITSNDLALNAQNSSFQGTARATSLAPDFSVCLPPRLRKHPAACSC